MTKITIKQIMDAVADTLSTAATAEEMITQEADGLTESVADVPLLQVYPVRGGTDKGGGNNDRTTFGAAVRQTEITFYADYYARQRSQIDEDMAAVVDGMDALIDVLETQKTKPLFGLNGIQAFRWDWEHVTFTYGDPALKYTGIRFTIVITVF